MKVEKNLEDVFINDGINALDVLIVGNGFDLNLNLKTSYNDFHTVIKSVFKRESISDKSKIINEWEEIGYSYVEKKSAEKLIDLILSHKENFYLQYFSRAKYGEWNEFEKQLEKIYRTFDYLLDFLSNYTATDSNYYQVLVNDVYKLPAFHIFDYVTSWSYFLFSLSTSYPDSGVLTFKGLQLRNIRPDVFKAKVEEFKNKVPKLLFNDLEFFSYLFQLYLDAFTQADGLKCKQFKVKTLINYNYTNYAEEVLNPENTLYLHGKLQLLENENENEFKNTIIFGVDEKTTFINRGFERFKKTIIRSLYETDISRLSFYLDEIKSNRGPYDYAPSIGIIGHSLDLIDEDSLKMILSKKYSIFYVFYYDDEGRFNLIYNLRAILGQAEYNILFNSGKIKFFKISDLIIEK